MQTFIEYIFNFVNEIYLTVRRVISNATYTGYTNFLDTNITSDGSLIGLNLTYGNLLLYCTTWFLIIFFIVLVFKIVFKVIGLICLK